MTDPVDPIREAFEQSSVSLANVIQQTDGLGNRSHVVTLAGALDVFTQGWHAGRADLLAEQAKAVPFRPPNFEETLDMMELTGGSFVRALAAAMYRADAPNRAKLVAAFPEYLREYSARALLERK